MPPSSPRLSLPIRALLTLLVLGGAPACGDQLVGARPPSQSLNVPWEGRLRELFDDDIEAASAGVSIETGLPRIDRLTKPRTLEAQFIAKMRVTTITRDQVGENVDYHVILAPVPPPLLPSRYALGPVELNIRPGDPAFAVVRSLENRMSGMTFTVFGRRFLGKGGELDVHVHLAPSTVDVEGYVRDTIQLREVSVP